MKFELKRKIDELGRIVLPIDLRRYYGIESGDTIVLLPVAQMTISRRFFKCFLLL